VVLAVLIEERVEDGDGLPSTVNGETSVCQPEAGARGGTIGVG
jgi:hypothetical protein